jgi:hypothetical protein
MKNLKFALLSILMILPLMAFADHEEVLITVFIQAISIIIFPIVLLAVKLKVRHKVILALVYIVITVLIWIITNQIPYRDNMTIINLLIALGPFAGVAIAYLFIARNKKVDKFPDPN